MLVCVVLNTKPGPRCFLLHPGAIHELLQYSGQGLKAGQKFYKDSNKEATKELCKSSACRADLEQSWGAKSKYGGLAYPRRAQ